MKIWNWCVIAGCSLGLVLGIVAPRSARGQLQQTQSTEPVETDSITASSSNEVKPAPTLPSQRFFGGGIEPSLHRIITPPDAVALVQEDEENRGPEDLRYRIGVSVPIDHDSAGSGPWIDLGPNGRLWSFEIGAPGARHLRVNFRNFALEPGSELYVVDALNHDNFVGPYTSTGPRGNGTFWSATLNTDTVILELWVPKEAHPQLDKVPFQVESVLYGYRDSDPSNDFRIGTCYLDSTCYAGYPRNAIGRMSYVSGGSGFSCSGALLNPQNSDFTPYFSTANHCISTQTEASTVDVAWFFQTSTCNGTPPSSSSVPHSLGATLLATQSSNDSTLLMIDGALPGGLQWMGWTTATPSSGADITGISHPGGSYKRISFGETASPSTNFHRVNFDDGTVAPGSSGSPLLDSNNRFVGPLCCGSVNCSTPTNTASYGRFSTFYSQVSTLLQGGSDDGLENNDTCTTARFLSGSSYGNLIVKNVDRDFYRFNVPPLHKATVLVNFTHDDGDIDTRIFDFCGGPVLDTSSSTSNNEQLVVENPNGFTKDYYFEVFLFSDTRNDYSIQIILEECEVDDTLENNDTCSSARSMIAGSTTNLFVSKADTDWYRIQVPAYTTVSVAAEFTDALGDIDLTLFTACGGGVVDSSTSTSDDEFVSYTNSTGNTITAFANVYVWTGSAEDCNLYELILGTTPCDADDFLEQNDLCAAATTLSEGQINNLLSQSADDDWFQITVPPGETAEVDVFFVDGLGDIDVQLFESCGGSLLTSSTSISDDEMVSYRNTTLTSQVYSVRVYLFSGTCNLYDISFSLIDNAAPQQPMAPQGDARGFEGGTVEIIFLGVDSDGDAMTFHVNWGDGSSSSVPGQSGVSLPVRHSYATEGSYNVRFSLTDSYGASSGNSPNWTIMILDVDNRRSTVDLDNGGPAIDVLRVNGSVGQGPGRVVTVNSNTSLTISLNAAPAGPSGGAFAVWGWNVAPTLASYIDLPFNLGAMSMNPLLNGCGSVCPVYSATNIPNRCGQILCATPEATGASLGTVMLISSRVLSSGQTLYFQGVLKDLSDTSGKRFSVTNGIEVEVQ